ncbi:MAG TPA: hypothetical protein VJ801_07305 [Polyangia bacterium]|jgi:hypothetical protein|nr:hypothetical protein [Polyangia bacterium]
MALYGQNLAKSVHQGISWDALGGVLSTLAHGTLDSYSALSLWENWKANGTVDTLSLAILQQISPDDAPRVRAMLDDDLAATMALEQLCIERGDENGVDAEAAADYVARCQDRVSVGSQLIATVDSIFHTNVAVQVSDQIVPAVGAFTDKVANTISKVLGNLVAGLWPWFAAAGVVLYFWSRGWKVRA